MPGFLSLSLPEGVRRRFAREAGRDGAETREVPTDAPRLRAGQRVEFNLHPGEDGPCYATEVQLITDPPKTRADPSA